jgi:hypothetical protein
MPFTRNLYEMDEVIAALQYNLRNGWGRAVFWCWELKRSMEYELLRNTLQESWLRWGAPQDPTLATLFPTLHKKSKPEEWITVTLRVMQACSYNTVRNTYLITTLQEALQSPTRPHMTPTAVKKPRTLQRRQRKADLLRAAYSDSEEIPVEEAIAWMISLDSACRQGDRKDALWLLQAVQQTMSADTIWTILRLIFRGGAPTQQIIQDLQAAASPHPFQQLLSQAAAIAFLCQRTQERNLQLTETPAAPPIAFYTRDWRQWDEVVGTRAARIHTIPQDALHKGTSRGQLPHRFTNIDDLYDPIPGLALSCTFWKTILGKYGILYDESDDTIAFPDDEDDTLECFHDDLFPDDIPDEWSKADQAKSHGRGNEEYALPAPTQPIREDIPAPKSWYAAIHVPKRRATGRR